MEFALADHQIAAQRLVREFAQAEVAPRIRTAAVNVVATATLAALVGWGGLGRFIIDGLAQQDAVQLFAGALLVAVLSTVVEFSLAGLQRLTMPAGLKVRERSVKDEFVVGLAARPA